MYHLFNSRTVHVQFAVETHPNILAAIVMNVRPYNMVYYNSKHYSPTTCKLPLTHAGWKNDELDTKLYKIHRIYHY